MDKRTKQEFIAHYKILLADTDYQCNKFVDGSLTEAEYAPIRAQRQQWRDEINRLENELEVNTDGI